MNITWDFLKNWVPQVRCEGASLEIDGTWSVDSRCVQPGYVFVALAGAHTDGHTFIEDALMRGARTCVIKESYWPTLQTISSRFLANCTFVIVPDPYEALIAWASAWRKQFTYPVIGVTGSIGKTSTKEYIAHVFRRCGKSVVASEGNQNTLLGIALNILRMRAYHEYAIFEMGIESRGEMKHLVDLALPTTGVITSIGHQHMGGLGSLADIAAEKRLIFGALQKDGVGFVNGDQPLLSQVAYAHPVIKFGLKMINQIQARQIQHYAGQISCTIKLYRDRYALTLPTEHHASIYHALAAAAVAHFFNLSTEQIIQALQEPLSVPGRFQKRVFGVLGQHMIIDDTYNANPESMKAALLAFERCETTGKKIAVLGDMLGLGINAPFWHRQIGRFLKKSASLQHVILVGDHMKWASKILMHSNNFELQSTWQDAVGSIQRHIEQEPTCILIKGSHNVGLHHVVSALVEQV